MISEYCSAKHASSMCFLKQKKDKLLYVLYFSSSSFNRPGLNTIRYQKIKTTEAAKIKKGLGSGLYFRTVKKKINKKKTLAFHFK